MTQAIQTPGPFIYQAQTLEGQPVSGTIDATSTDQAQRLLGALRLRVLNIEAATTARPVPSGKPLRAEDFLAFNQQLAHLTSAGMPIEQGLRLIAQDMRSGRMATTIRDLAAEMERGVPLEQAFEKHKDRFPALYSRLIGAGVSSGNLPGMLLNLGRHMELIQRLRASLWRTAAYPLMVLVGVGFVVTFLSLYVIPKFEVIFKDFGTRLPALTEWMLQLPVVMPWVLGAVGIGIVALIVIWMMLKAAGYDRVVMEQLALPMPMIGPILRYNLLARWCDAVGLGTQAGLDLPRSIELANDAIASPALRRDGNKLVAAIRAGNPLESAAGTRLLPATVVAAMSLASQRNDLPSALSTLSEMYQQQAQLRLSLVPALLTPLLLIIVAGVIGAIVLALFLPLISLIQNISSPMKK